MSDKKNKTHFHVAARTCKLPQPIEVVGQNGEVKYGSDNLYKQWLYKLYYESPTHSGIIDSKVFYITAGGLKYEGANQTEFDEAFKNGRSKFDLQELTEMLCLDNEVIGDFYIKCTRDIMAKKWFFDVLDSELMRNDKTGIYFYYSENWAAGTQSEKDTAYKKYTSIEHIDPLKDTECVIYVKSRAKQFILDKKKVTCSVYPVPKYSGALKSIQAEIEMSSFQLSEVVNGYTGGTIISLKNGIPEDDDRKKFEADTKASAQDIENKGGIAFLYSEGSEAAAEIHTLNGNNLSDRYLNGAKAATEKIMIAHSVTTPALFGVSTPGQLGENSQLEIGYNIFKKSYAASRQRTISEAITYGLKKLNGFTGEIKFNEYVLDLEQQIESKTPTADALNKMSPLLANNVLAVMTINEQRALAGLAPIEGGDLLASSAPASVPSDFRFKTQDKVLSRLLSCGVDRNSLNIVYSAEVKNFESIESFEREVIGQCQIERFAKLTPEDKKILNLIKEGTSFNDTVKQINKPPAYVSGRITALTKSGYIEKVENKNVVTELGQNEIEEIEFKVFYTYEKRPDAPDLVKGGKSREFCTEMLKADKAFTRSEIDQISNDEGTSVWLYKGGWYHNPDTDKNQPACRHYWKLNVVL